MEKTKILLIEDEESLASFIQPELELEGYEVVWAKDGKEGLEFFEKEKPTLILLDWMLPVYDGITVLRRIRKVSDIPIIMLTARNQASDISNALDQGLDDYMTKPFSPSELVARVKAHMARYERLVGTSQRAQNDIVEIRGIRIDKTARRVYVDGVEKTFTTKEFELLTFLAENPNHVFTKEELFREIWDMDSIGDIATVTVHIKKIREKVEADTAKPQYIETIWGVGYRFKV